MVSTGNMKQRVYEELVTVLSTYTTDDTDTHVGVLNGFQWEELPAIAFDASTNPRTNEANKTVIVSEKSYTNDELDQIEYAELLRLTVDVVVRADDEGTTDDIQTDLREQFVTFYTSLQPSDFHPDCTSVQVGGAEDDERGPYVRGDALTIEFDFERYQTFSDFVPIRDIEFAVSEQDFDPNTELIYGCRTGVGNYVIGESSIASN